MLDCCWDCFGSWELLSWISNAFRRGVVYDEKKSAVLYKATSLMIAEYWIGWHWNHLSLKWPMFSSSGSSCGRMTCWLNSPTKYHTPSIAVTVEFECIIRRFPIIKTISISLTKQSPTLLPVLSAKRRTPYGCHCLMTSDDDICTLWICISILSLSSRQRRVCIRGRRLEGY